MNGQLPLRVILLDSSDHNLGHLQSRSDAPVVTTSKSSFQGRAVFGNDVPAKLAFGGQA